MIPSIEQLFRENERLLPLLSVDSAEDWSKLMPLCAPAHVLAKEDECATKRWFDVRDLHPLQATAYFAECFMLAFAKVMEVKGRADYRSAPFRTGIKRVFLLEQSPNTLTGLWKARQVADLMSCPYYDFVFMLQIIAERRGRRYLLTPSQLYQKELLEIFQERWNSRLNTKLLFSDDPYFTTEHYCHDIVQDQHRNFVSAQIQLHPHARQPLLLAAALFSHSLMTKQYAQQRFPTVYDAALKWAHKIGIDHAD